MPIPTANTGKLYLPAEVLRNKVSATISTAPISTPIRIKSQFKLCAKIPLAIVVIKVACGAPKACEASISGRGNAPVKP